MNGLLLECGARFTIRNQTVRGHIVYRAPTIAASPRFFGASTEDSYVEITKSSAPSSKQETSNQGCGIPPLEEDDDEDEQEDMFVEPHMSMGTTMVEWGGPRRGGRLAEPTRFGDWERKGRCTDF